jgi:phosphoribosyl 1,2-cyclic phosphodiesterase
MTLTVLGSGSKGNCYLLDSGSSCLMIEAGIPFIEVKKALDFDISRITACICTHCHGDHFGHVKEVLDAHIPVYTSKGTLDAKGLKPNGNTIFAMEALKSYQIGEYTVMPFDTQHDAPEPFGFLIYHKDMGITLFATDTYYLKYRFKNLSNIMIECNYSLDILNENGTIPNIVRNRTIKSHMSYDTCKETLLANDLSIVNNIVLIHLSDNNSDSEMFRKGIEESTGKTTFVAKKGMKMEFNKTPF